MKKAEGEKNTLWHRYLVSEVFFEAQIDFCDFIVIIAMV
jgi:hypothetical protein